MNTVGISSKLQTLCLEIQLTTSLNLSIDTKLLSHSIFSAD